MIRLIFPKSCINSNKEAILFRLCLILVRLGKSSILVSGVHGRVFTITNIHLILENTVGKHKTFKHHESGRKEWGSGKGGYSNGALFSK